MECRFLWVDFSDEIAPAVYVAITVVTMCIAFVGNLTTTLIIVRKPELRNDPTYLLICSVCIADVLVATIVQPLFICTMILGTRRYCILDNAYYASAWIAAMASGIGVLPVTLERYIYIVYPLHYRSHVTKQRSQIAIIISWTSSLLFGIVPLFWYNPLLNHSISLLIVLVISVFMIIAYRQIYNRVTAIVPDLTKTDSVSVKRRRKHQIQGQATRTVFFVVLSFFICWFPYLLVSFIVSLYDHDPNDQFENYAKDSMMLKIYWGCLVLGYCNSSVNVFIYARKNSVLRQAITLRLRKFIQKRIDQNQSKTMVNLATRLGFHDRETRKRSSSENNASQ